MFHKDRYVSLDDDNKITDIERIMMKNTVQCEILLNNNIAAHTNEKIYFCLANKIRWVCLIFCLILIININILMDLF